MKPIINKTRCPALIDVCKVIAACPPHAIRYVRDENERLGGLVYIVDRLCNACGICVTECCGHAIEMIPA